MNKHKLKLISIALLAVLAIVVMFQNTTSVETKILFVSVTMPRSLLLLMTLAVGFVLGILFSLMASRKKPDAS